MTFVTNNKLYLKIFYTDEIEIIINYLKIQKNITRNKQFTN